MPSLLFQQIDALSREKGIDPQIVVSAVEDAIVVATRKYYKSQEDLRAELDKETGAITAFAVKQVVEGPEQVEDPNLQMPLAEAKKLDAAAAVGGEVRINKPTDVLGRIAAQMAKQVIFQKVREAERETVYNEYVNRVNEIVTVTVRRQEGPEVIFELGTTEARMPRKEQSRLESFAIGERVRAVIVRVEKAAKGPQVVVSRAAPELVQHLFQTEVPEIYDGTVVIRAIAREAGERTKIAVMSRDKDVDSVGACVGMKGMRVQSIIRELRGEKIDIIEFHEDAVVFAEKALQPAKVGRVSVLDAAEKHLEVIVDDSQLSLAIGKKGQNVRLAAKLLGYRIDIKSEEEKRQEVELQMSALVGGQTTPLEEVPGLGEGLIQKLIAAGVSSVESLADMTPEQLEAIPGVGPKTVEKISLAVNNYFVSLGVEAAPAGELPPEGVPEAEMMEPPADDAATEPAEAILQEAAAEGVPEGAAAEAVYAPAEEAVELAAETAQVELAPDAAETLPEGEAAETADEEPQTQS